jgi:predicted AAA+ superfamily ATPase
VDKDYLIRLIREFNPGLEGRTYSVPLTRRDLYDEIGPWLSRKQAIAITGLRRTGKTTLMRQLQDRLPGTSIFFSFDEEETRKKEVLVFVLDYVITTLNAKNILLDEIQYVEDYEGTLKRYYDQKGLKFILSGSESLDIYRAKAALAGRIATFTLPPLSFGEYLLLKGVTAGSGPATLTDYPSMERLYEECLTRKEFFEQEFGEYIYKGAFPELVEEQDAAVIRKYIHDLVVKKIVYRDIPSIFEVRRPDILLGLFRYAGSTTSQLFDIQNLARHFSVHAETIANYLWYLQSAFLVHTAESYSASPAKRARRNKKLSVAHPAIACALLGYDRTQLVEPVLGPYVETLFAGRYFWRDKYKREVDVVRETREGLLPIEIKYQAGISPSDTKNLRYFMEEFNVSRGILITKDKLDRKTSDGKEILFIPAWLALLAQNG